MPRDDDELDDEERELIRQHRQSRHDEDDSDEVEVGFADGSYVRGAYRRVSEAAAARGLKLRPDPEPEDDGKAKPKTGGSNVKRFSGRRIS